MTDLVTARRALLSVSDKTGLVELAEALSGHGIELVSTGGTAKAMREAGLSVTDVAEITGSPEMMDGRVKTLHPKIHGGLLGLRDAHAADMAAHGIEGIDILVVNLYPFEATVARDATPAECIENIDIGGPAMLRAAAKNHAWVAVVTDAEDYAALTAELAAQGGATTQSFREGMAQLAYGRTAAYDAAVSTWMAQAFSVASPRRVAAAGTLVAEMRYGENPHQTAAFYRSAMVRPGVATARLLQGKALSYNNINDTDAAFELVSDLAADRPHCAIIKHANPCGVAGAETLAEAYSKAFDCDRVSAFGGIVALNRPLDGETARAIAEIFTEVVIAPKVTAEAAEIFAAKPALRLLETGALADPTEGARVLREVAGGYLLQDKDVGQIARSDLKVVTERTPDDAEMSDLLFAWTVAKHVKSNAIVYAKDGATVGVGAGQMSRVDSTRIAARKAEDMATALGLSEPPTRGAVVASDAFFPFPDGLLTAAEAGATAVIQPGGSVRDEEVIAAADEAGLAMVFTGMRHFRH